MFSKKLEQAVNEQIKHEIYSGYLYLAMAAQCESMNLNGFAHWLKVQAKEELGHAMKLYDFVNDRGGRVVLEAIDKPPVEYKSLQAMFEAVYEHEQKVTGLINKLYELAKAENDYPLQVHLQWFIDEQVEEEKNATEILARLKLVGESGSGLMMLDKVLGEREG
ncbi:MAG: ferritin [Candidatus Caldatribacteriaceae bacterium]